MENRTPRSSAWKAAARPLRYVVYPRNKFGTIRDASRYPASGDPYVTNVSNTDCF